MLSSLQNNAGTWQYFIGCAYVAAVFIAPLCTATAILRAVELFLRRGAYISIGSKAVTLLYGWGPTAEAVLLNNGKGKAAVCLVTGEELTDKQQLDLLRHNVFLCKARQEERMRKKADRIFLLDKSSARNFSQYVALQHWWESYARGEAPKVFCACEDAGVRALFTSFHDESSRKHPEAGALPVSLFSMAELQAKAVWDACPICEYNFSEGFRGTPEDRYRVHMVLVGLGSIGRQLLEQAVSLGVLSSYGEMHFDVIDRNANELLRFFKSSFSSSYVQVNHEKGMLTIPPDRADGTLTIRFHQLNVDDGDFIPLLRRLNGEHPFTFAAICLKDTDTAIRCLNQLDRVLEESGRAIPVAVWMGEDQELAQYFRGETPYYGKAFPICRGQNALSLDALANGEAYAGAVQFKYAYSRWSATLSGDAASVSTPEAEWRKMEYFKQRSSLFQYLHQPVKALRLAYERSREDPFTLTAGPAEYEALGEPPLTEPLALEFARMEHRRWCYYMAASGWTFGEKRNKDRQINPCMVTWEALVRGDQQYTCRYDTTPYRILTQQEVEERAV